MRVVRRTASFLFHRIDAFHRCERGNIAVIFTIALIPLLAFVGAAVDYSEAARDRTALQNALDTAALMIAKDNSATSLTPDAVTQKAQAIVTGMYNRPDVTNVSVSGTLTSGGNASLVLTGSGTMATHFMGLIGYHTMAFSTSSTITWGNSRLRVALVLDNTGSMAQSGKLTALKTATKNLLSQLKGAASTNEDVYVSIIPFAKDVNVDPTNYGATWIDWTEWDAANGSCSGNRRGTSGSTQSSCQSNGGTWTHANHNTWNGCVVDRGNTNGPDTTNNYDTNVAAPDSGIRASKYAAEQYSDCTAAAMGLNYNWSNMNTLVTNMVASGNTNQAIGLQLGWMSLVGGGPFTAPAQDPNYKYQQVIILLTDGLNTQDRWYSSQTSIDNREKLTCQNIKNAKVTLYAVQVNTGGDPTSTLLQNCATDSSKFFLLTSANEIVTTFGSIGTQLSQLRIAK